MHQKTMFPVLCVVVAMMGAACGTGNPPPTAPTVTATPTASPTPRAEASSTPSPAPTSTLEPTLAPVVMPDLPEWPALPLPSTFTGEAPPGAVARLGQGVLTIVRVSPRGRYIAVGGSMGVTVYETGSYKQVWFGSTPASVAQLEWSPDGWRIAASTGDETIIVWDISTGARVVTIKEDGRQSLDWSPDSTKVAAGSYEDGAYVWDATTGALLHHIDVLTIPGNPPPPFPVYAAFSPDGRFIATTYKTMVADAYTILDRVDLWDAGTGVYLRTLEGYKPLTKAWSQHGQSIPVVDEGGLAIWNIATNEVTRSPVSADIGLSPVSYINLSPDRKWLAVGTTLFSVETGDPLPTSGQQVRFIDWSPDGTRYAAVEDIRQGTYDESFSLVIRDTRTGTELFRIAGINGTAGFSPDWSTFYGWIGTRGFTLHGATGHWYYPTLAAWDVATGAQRAAVVTGTQQLQSLTWSPDGTKLATGSLDSAHASSAVVIWDANTGEALHSFSPGNVERTYVAWSPEGGVLAVLADWLRLWDVERNQLIDDIGTGSSWSPDGGMIVVGGESVITIWDAHSGSRLHRLEGHTWAGVSSLDWLPNEGVIASLSASDQAILWNASTGARIRTLDIAQAVQDMAASPDGRLLAVHGDTFITVWDVQTGMLLYKLKGAGRTKGRFWFLGYYIEGTPSVAWSPDGTKLAAAWRKIWIGGPSTIHVWDATTGQLLHEFEGHTADVPALAFSPDGTRLASGSMDGTVILWNVGQ